MTQRGLYDEHGKPLSLRPLAEVNALRLAVHIRWQLENLT